MANFKLCYFGFLISLLLLIVLPTSISETSFDYIVVGAGSSGSVVANRLTEDPTVTVLLIEAGGHPPEESEVPYRCGELEGTPFDWKYRTEPQTNACKGFEGSRCLWPRGKVLGGSSVLNYMVYVRGNPQDYDEWASHGAVGWDYRSVLPYFIKAEGNTDKRILEEDDQTSPKHGRDGPLTVSTPDLLHGTPLGQAFFDAGKILGYDYIDHNREPTGFSKIQATMRDGKRCSTEKAYLRPAYERKNLEVLTNARVIKISFDDSKRADSVIYLKDGNKLEARAKREIILSAGAIGSPQILMLSGIGPKSHLEKYKIPVIADLPVGRNLQDHIAAGGVTMILNSTVSFARTTMITEESEQLFKEGRGPLTITCGLVGLGFVNSKYNMHQKNWPDIQLAVISAPFVPMGLSEQVERSMKSHPDEHTVSILPYIMRPNGRGFIELRSSDPLDDPVIEPNYLSNDDDLKVLIEGLKISRRVAESKPFEQFNPKLHPEVLPGCEQAALEHGLWSDEYLECVSRTLTFTVYHYLGTCKMGDPWDPTTVVDPQLRVKEVTGLRVVDASVIPIMVSGNINAACIMIGEKAADMIAGKSPLQYMNKGSCSRS